MKLVLLLVVAAAATPLEQTVAEDTAVAEAGADREGKLFSVFQIVQFNNDVCETIDGQFGTCFTAAECTSKGGQDAGPCASSFGVCCKAIVDPSCPTTIQINNTYIVNPGFPGEFDPSTTCATSGSAAIRQQPRIFFPVAATEAPVAVSTSPPDFTDPMGVPYTYKIRKSSDSVVQIRLDFETFMIAQPVMGTCTNESLTITGMDAVTSKVLPMNLCGDLTGQHIILSVKTLSATDEVTVTVTISGDRAQMWSILVSQYESTQMDLLAPRGCLQYYTEDAGSFSTFNFVSGAAGELLNGHMYSVCLADNDAYCDVALTSDMFSLSGIPGECKDAVSFGVTAYCTDTFANLGTLTWNYTGAYQIPIFTDGDNMEMKEGFKIDFIKLPC